MAKQFNMTVRLKNITENTVAVAGTVVSPKASVPVKVKKASGITSILLNHQQGKVEILNFEASALAALVGFDLGQEEETEGKSPEGEDKAPETVEPKDEDKSPEGEDKAPEPVEPKVEDKKSTTKKPTAKKPAVKKEETEQPNLLEENE